MPTENASKTTLDTLLAMATEMAPSDGFNKGTVDYLQIVRRSKPSSPLSGVLSPAFCLILQGTKVIETNAGRVVCGRGDFLASLIEVPVLVHVEEASTERPYLGLKIEFSVEEIAEIVRESDLSMGSRLEAEPRNFVGTSDHELQEILTRILGLTPSKNDQYRGRLLRKDLLFHLLSGPYGHLFFSWIVSEQGGRLRHALVWLRENFDQPLRVEDLAEHAHMSVSSLQHQFKAATSFSVLQYQKMLRLQKARLLLFAGELDITEIAFNVGYQSLSQFSREYKRFFARSPRADLSEMKLKLAPHLSPDLHQFNQALFAE